MTTLEEIPRKCKFMITAGFNTPALDERQSKSVIIRIAASSNVYDRAGHARRINRGTAGLRMRIKTHGAFDYGSAS